jgi:outer membrane protein assembly factor BamB
MAGLLAAGAHWAVALPAAPAAVPAGGADTWASFHNGGDSRTAARNLPGQWSPERGIAWQAELPGYGQSAPVVWKGTVFVTAVAGPNKEKNRVVALDARSGRPRWQREFASSMPAASTRTVSHAAPTPVVDPTGLTVFFESGDLIGLSLAGEVRWQRSLTREYGEFKGGHGLGSSLAVVGGRVIVLVDDPGASYLLAVEAATGKNAWKTGRPARLSWTSPVIARRGDQDEIVVSSNGAAQGYDPATGALRWSLEGLTGNLIPTPGVDGDRVYLGASVSARSAGSGASAVESNCCLQLVEKGGKPAYQVRWRSQKAVCDYASPVAYRDNLYLVNSAGVLFCLDAATGTERYAERLDGPCWATPIAAGGYLYCFGKNGVTTVVRAGPTFEKVASNRLWDPANPPEPSAAFPAGAGAANNPDSGLSDSAYLDPIVYGVAAVDDAFFLRTGTRLYCVRREER